MKREGADTTRRHFDPDRVDVRDCLLCGTEGFVRYETVEDRLFGVPGQASIWECGKCGLLWLSPRLPPEHIGEAYRDYYTHGEVGGPIRLARLRRHVQHLVLAGSFAPATQTGLAKLAGKLLLALPLVSETIEPLTLELRGVEPGRLVDVGCGDGRLLTRMRNFGWNVSGIEPDAVAADRVHREFGIPVFAGSLNDFKDAAGGYDVVVANHVIEHVQDPVAFAHDCFRLVKPGGRMVLLTPNARSLGHRIFGKNWFHLDPPRHLYLFTESTLGTCLNQAGVNPTRVRSLAGQGRETWQASRLIRRLGRVPEGFLPFRYKVEGLLFALVEEASRWAMSNTGEELMLVARKPL